MVSFSQVRNDALKKAKGDWVLFVDDDEVVSRELSREIGLAVTNKNDTAFYLKRRDVVFNQELKFGEVGNTKIIRLAKRNAGKFARDVHEVWEVPGKHKTLKNPLYHVKDSFVSEFIARIIQYGQLDAESLNCEKKFYNTFKLLFYPLGKFIKNYLFKQGFRDGYPGLFLALFISTQSLSVRIFQWEKQNH